MKKRLISLLLAFSMMLTFLPAGAVSAFAEAGETIGEATIVPTPGHLIATKGGDWIAFITQPGKINRMRSIRFHFQIVNVFNLDQHIFRPTVCNITNNFNCYICIVIFCLNTKNRFFY